MAAAVETRFGRAVEGVIPNGVDVDFFSPALAGSKPPIGPASGYVLFVGALTPSKHPERVLEIARRMPGTKFVMIGRLDPTGFATGMMREINQASNVTYLGFVERATVRDILGAASVLVHPSDVEGMSNATLEASAMGVPVVGLPVREMSEIVEEGINGWLIPYNGPDEWLSKIQAITQWDGEARVAFAKASRDWVTTHFTWEAAAEKLGRFFARVLT